MPDDNADNGRSWLERISQLFASEPGSREELQALIRSLRGREVVDEDTLGILEGALEVSSLQVRDIMVPRSQMITLRADMTPKDFLPLIIECAHSRFPVLGADPDEVIWWLLAQDLISPLYDEQALERVAF